jgi:hypothetical protein
MDTMVLKAKAVAAAALLTEETSEFQVSLLFAKLSNDPVINERALALGFEEDTSVMVADLEDYAEIIAAMTPEEKQALRERIAGR